MSKKAFAALCGVTVIAVVLAVITMLGQPRLEMSDMQGETVFPKLVKDVDGLKTLVIRHADQTVSIDWDGKVWRVRERGNYPADAEKLSALVVNLARMTKIEGKTRQPDRYARLEVEDPTGKESKSRQVSLLDVNGKEIAQLIVGKKLAILGGKEGGTYIRLPGDPQVWLVSGELNADAAVAEWLKKDIADIKDTSIARVAVTHPNGEKVIVERDGGKLAVANLPKGAQPVSPYAADEYGRLLTSMTLEDVAPATDKPFPKDKTITALIEGAGGFQVMLDMAELGEQTWIKIKGTAPPADASDSKPAEPKPGEPHVTDLRTDWPKIIGDINARAEGWVYQVPSYQVAPLKRRLTDLVKKPDVAPKSAPPV